MYQLKIIYNLLRAAKYLILAGAVFAMIISAFFPEGPAELGGPYWKIDDSELLKQINDLMPTRENISFTFKASLIAPLSLSIKLMITLFIVLVSAFFFYLLHLAQQVVSDIISGKTFTLRNIKRIKFIGIIIVLSMIGEKALVKFGEFWIGSNYQFEGLTLVNKSELNWYIAIVGAIIYAMGVAFEQGLKLQEEQDLTI